MTWILGCSSPPERRAASSLKGDVTRDASGSKGATDESRVVDENGDVLLINTAFPRLSHRQWENSVRDVLYLPNVPGLSVNFLADPPGSLFGNDASLLKITPNLWTDYQKAAEQVAADLVANAEQVKKLLPPTLPSDAKELAKAIVEPLAMRAYRRYPNAGETDALVQLFLRGEELTGNPDRLLGGLHIVVAALLQSPNFLYRSELGASQVGTTVVLTASEIASRLSYAIWNSIPDTTLIDLADSGDLLKPEVRKAQVTRMMKDPRALSILTFFFAKALRIDSFLTIAPKDSALFPEWSADLNTSIHREAELFIADVVGTSGKGLNEVLTAPYTFVNDKTAPLYGLKTVGNDMKKVALDPSQRAGFLTQIGFLALNATKSETDPIHRGVYSSVNIACADLVPPAGIIPTLPKESEAKTMRERVEAHTGKGTCGSSCHGNLINPAGYAFENFDAAGRWRTSENGQAIDAAAELFLGATPLPFNGPVEFSKALAGNLDVHKCFAAKALELLYGRVHDDGDKGLIRAIAKASLDGASTQDLFFQLLNDAKITQRVSKE